MEKMMDNETFDEVLNGFKEADSIVKRLKTRIVELEEENKKLKDKIDHLEFDIEDWKKLKAVWEKKEQKLQIEIGGLIGERDGLKMVVEKLKEENQTLELWLDNKEKLKEEYRKKIDTKFKDGFDVLD